MKHFSWIFTLSFTLVFLSLGPVEAQRRGGSVRYSGRSTGASTMPARSNYGTPRPTTSTPVRYQKPMNMPPPIGSRPSTLPVGYRRSVYGGSSYYYYGGAYYADTYEDGGNSTSGIPGYPSGPSKKPAENTAQAGAAAAGTPGRYAVVKPPLGVAVDQLPYGATEVKKNLWEFQDVYYRPGYQDGQVKYIVSNP